MVPILSLIIVVVLSMLVTRIAAVALTMTGLSRQSARFQARSAFSGAGFTTNESERVVNHPVRRRVILILMLLGNAGVITAVSSLILTFVGKDDGGGSTFMKIMMIVGSLTLLWIIGSSKWVDRHLSRIIEKWMSEHTRLEVTDYANLMQLAGDYRIVEIAIKPDDWLAGKTLAQSRLRSEGIVVLGIQRRAGEYFGVPDGDSLINEGDTLIAYGRLESIRKLDERGKNFSGDLDHHRAVREQEEIARQEQERDQEFAEKEQS